MFIFAFAFLLVSIYQDPSSQEVTLGSDPWRIRSYPEIVL